VATYIRQHKDKAIVFAPLPRTTLLRAAPPIDGARPLGFPAAGTPAAACSGSSQPPLKPAALLPHPSNVTMTAAAFICFKIRNRLHDFISARRSRPCHDMLITSLPHRPG
jgi:hypothetical protein